MRDAVTIPRELFNRLRAFVNSIASGCDACYRRDILVCYECPCSQAVHLRNDIERLDIVTVERAHATNDHNAVSWEILGILNNEPGGLLADAIILPGVPRHIKSWNIKRLCKAGRLSSRNDGRGTIYYLTDVQRARLKRQPKHN